MKTVSNDRQDRHERQISNAQTVSGASGAKTCHADSLIVSCNEAVVLFEDKLGYNCEEAFLEESALNLIARSFRVQTCGCGPYKFVFIDLDDPTLLMSRFMQAL